MKEPEKPVVTTHDHHRPVVDFPEPLENEKKPLSCCLPHCKPIPQLLQLGEREAGGVGCASNTRN